MRVYLESVGCRLNQAEIEQFARQLRAYGHTLVATPSEADFALINTCTVTTAADSDSRKKIRQLTRAGVSKLIATGCWVTLNPQIALELDSVAQIVPNDEKDELVRKYLQPVDDPIDLEPLQREIIPGARFRTRAFIKAQDGCNNRCTFCVTTIARGRSRSRLLDNILADIRAITELSKDDVVPAKEVVLTGVHLGSWGRDLSPQLNLSDLIKGILQETDVPRIRISSLEPWDIESDFFNLWEDERLCRHLHLPLQSGCARTLRNMARKTTPVDFARLLKTARRLIPDVAITTDIIVGFPGESNNDFLESINYVKEMNFAGGHVFTYSARPGTLAADMSDQIDYQIRKERNATLQEIFMNSKISYQKRFLGSTMRVLWESVVESDSNHWQVSGLTDNYLRVTTLSDQTLWNQITPTKLQKMNGSKIIGQVV